MPKIPKKATVYAVLAFIALFTWGYVREARAASQDLVIGLGFGAANSEGMTTQRIGYMYDRKWYARAERFGGPDYSDQKTWAFAAGRRVNWRRERTVAPFMEFGVIRYNDILIEAGDRRQRPLVSDEWMYTLAVGVNLWGVVDFGWDHNSTAGRSERNSGIDRVHLTYTFEF